MGQIYLEIFILIGFVQMFLLYWKKFYSFFINPNFSLLFQFFFNSLNQFIESVQINELVQVNHPPLFFFLRLFLIFYG